MLSALRCAALGFSILLTTQSAMAPAAFGRERSGIEALAASVPTVVRQGPVVEVPSGSGRSIAAICPGGGLTDKCYDDSVTTTQYVNVATFFDRRCVEGRSGCSVGAADYMVKYFEPPTPGRYQILGFTFRNNRAGTVFPNAGVVVTNAEAPLFPTFDDLRLLPVVGVAGLGKAEVTCVDVTRYDVVLEADQAAWLVVHIPADTAFVGLQSETERTDHPCDFMTRDQGDYWYRPDPQQSNYDWMMTPYFVALPSRPQSVEDRPWSAVKVLYR